MDIYRVTRPRLREIDQECQAHLGRLEALLREIERIRAAMKDAEDEIAGVWASRLPRQNQLLFERVLRVRCRRMEATLSELQREAAAIAPPARLPYRNRRWE